MIRLENVQKTFGPKVILDQADLVVNPGEKVGLIGLNGTGKTTLLRIIEGVEEYDGGRVDLPGRTRVGTLRQELEDSDQPILAVTLAGDRELMELRHERDRLHDRLADSNDADEQHRLSTRWGEVDHRLEEIGSYHAEARAGSILLGLGFPKEGLEKPLNAYSGGWRMRVALAQLLFSRPDILLLDEPTNHLDLESVAWFENHLRGMPGTVIAVSHDQGFLNRVTRITVELERGTLTRFVGPFDRYVELKTERLELLEKQIASQSKQIAQINRFIERFRYKATKARQVQSRVKQLEKIEVLESAAASGNTPRIRLPEPERSALEMLKVRHLDKTFGNNPVLSKVNFNFQRGEKVGLLGPNGAGKSTFLKVLAGELPADRGDIQLGDRVKTAYFTQHALEALNPDETIFAEAQAAAPRNMKEQALRTLLGGFLFSGEDIFKKVAVLSGGERARLALVRMFLSGANLLLLDEPTNHLDMEARAALGDALENYGGSLLLVTHDRDLMATVCNRFFIIANQKIIEHDGSLDSYLEQITQLRNEPTADDTPTTDATPNKREIKRQSGQIRESLQRDTRQQRRRAKELEETIHQLEEERETLEQRLTEADLYEESAKDQLKETLEKSRQLAEKLEKKMAEWEELSMAIEEREERARKALAALGVTG